MFIAGETAHGRPGSHVARMRQFLAVEMGSCLAAGRYGGDRRAAVPSAAKRLNRHNPLLPPRLLVGDDLPMIRQHLELSVWAECGVPTLIYPEKVMSIPYRCVSIALAWAALGVASMTWAQPATVAKPIPAGRHFGAAPSSILAMIYISVLPMPTVQEEMNLSADQQGKVKEATDKARAAMRELFAGIRNLSPEERDAKMDEVSKKMEAKTEETKKVFEGILLPKQLARLKGISLQMAGISALVDKEVQQDLKLSDEQVAKIKTATDDLMKKNSELRSEGADPSTLAPKMQQLRMDFEKQVTGALTADQKAALEKMKGAKFAFSGFGPRPAKPSAETKAKPSGTEAQ